MGENSWMKNIISEPKFVGAQSVLSSKMIVITRISIFSKKIGHQSKSAEQRGLW